MTTENAVEFVTSHESQLQDLNIPSPLHESLASQLNCTFVPKDDGSVDWENVLSVTQENFASLSENNSGLGCMVVIPHVCSWDMIAESNRGMRDALNELPTSVLHQVLRGLHALWDEAPPSEAGVADKQTLLNQICVPRTWSRVILYRRAETNSVRGALPVPPYPPQVEVIDETDQAEADVTGPFPFRYYTNREFSQSVLECSLAYLSPGVAFRQGELPTIDLVPSYSVPNALTRSVRYAALLENRAPHFCLVQVKEIYANFVQSMHLVRQQVMEQQQEKLPNAEANDLSDDGAILEEIADSGKVWKLYTDKSDPMELSHPVAGLTSSKFALTTSIDDADIIYSFQSLYGPGELRQVLERRPNVLINQFPYEGAFVQKDHLAREILQQHGLPRPAWALETYDLDVHLAEFVGAALLAAEMALTKEKPLWIIKPAHGTQSKGHVVTRSIAHVLKLVDAGGGSRVAQRYIENPVCYDGRKVDCRCIVMMTSANPPGRPTLFMHNRVYFRIAGKKHCISNSDVMDLETVLTAMHLVSNNRPQESSENGARNMPLPVDYKTIARLERDYKDVDFDWKFVILPKIHVMIRELFNGMTKAYPGMGKSKNSRALYGVDVMFEIGADGVEPKLTEVTFCPSNSNLGQAYERDQNLFETFNTDIFSCLFLGEVNDTITRLQ